jgi:ribosomal RNA-processing protein 12
LSNSEEEERPAAKGKKDRRKQETFIREGSEDPVDLLDQSAFSKVSSNLPIFQNEELRRRAKAAARASSFKSNQDGRMIIEEPHLTSKRREKGPTTEYNAYEEAHESTDMAKRGYRDRLKFSNKRGRQDAEDFDVEMTDAYTEVKTPPKKKPVIFDGRHKGIQKRRWFH